MLFGDSKTILIVVAHPDDEVLGCACLIQRLVSAGKKVHVLLVNQGNQLRAGFKQEELDDQIREVSTRLGADYRKLTFPASAFRDHRIDIQGRIQYYVNYLQPDVVITHDSTDLHDDHKVVYDGVMIACRFNDSSPVKTVLTFPVISSSDISPNWNFRPHLYVSASEEQVLIKEWCMKTYKHEYEGMRRHRGDGIRVWARFFGLQANSEYAEVFKVIRSTM